MRSNFRANERRGSSLTIPNAAESQEHLMPRLREEFLRDRLRLEIRTKILMKIRNKIRYIALRATWNARKRLWNSLFRANWNARKRLWNSPLRANWNARKRLWNSLLGTLYRKSTALKAKGSRAC